MKRILWEALLFLAVAAIAAFVVNLLHSRGLELGTNYFPPAPAAATAADSGEGSGGREAGRESAADPAPAGAEDAHAGHDHGLPEHEFQTVTADELKAYAEYAGEENRIYVLDARRDAEFAKGHIPNALSANNYDRKSWMPELLPKLKEADVILVYCTGGHCEDSIFLARALGSEGVPKDVLFLFEGGMEEWQELGHPVEP